MRRALALALLLALPTAARAGFADPEAGARALAMGGAFAAMSGDAASLFWNPAALHGDGRFRMGGMRTSRYDGLDGVDEDFLAVAWQPGGGRLAVGLGWARTALGELYHEDTVSLGAAWRTGRLWDLRVGASALFFGVDAPGYAELNDPAYRGAQWEPSASVGLMLSPSPELQLGASAENLARPEISLLSEGEVDRVGGRRRVGASYLLQEVVVLSAELRHHDIPDYSNRRWTIHTGAESWFNGVLALRVGLHHGDLTAGAGLLVDHVRVDMALLTHERLGNSYRMGIALSF